jgi:phage gp16-like protein
MSKLARDHRNSDLAKIHLAKKSLGMSDEDYRAMLWTQGRVTSSADLDHVGRQRVLDHLKACGFKPAASKVNKRPARPTPAPEKIKLVRRIRAQLISLGHLPDDYADGIAKQMYGVQYYEWATPEQLHAITSALGAEQRKKGAERK